MGIEITMKAAFQISSSIFMLVDYFLVKTSRNIYDRILHFARIFEIRIINVVLLP